MRSVSDLTMSSAENDVLARLLLIELSHVGRRLIAAKPSSNVSCADASSHSFSPSESPSVSKKRYKMKK